MSSSDQSDWIFLPIKVNFFLSSGGVQTLSFYVKEGELWADSGDGRPAILEPVESQEFKFTATDPESGFFEITFLKDEQGKYTKCRVFIEDQDLEIEGIKIGG
jgi:hypothetical protein